MRLNPAAGMKTLAIVVLCANASALAAQNRPGARTWQSVEDALGRKGAPQPGGVMKFAFPRSDLAVTVAGVTLKPAFALGSWVAFQAMPRDGAMAMGDLVLTETELAPVLTTLEAGGVDATAIHNHLLGESPRVLYMHIVGNGDPVKIATTIHDALERTGTPLTLPAVSPSAVFELDTTALVTALGRHGKVNGGVYQVSVPRTDPVRERGMEVPPSMGVAAALNFQPTGQGRAAITGDFVLTAGEVFAVTRALRENGIQVTALHSHMLGEQPRLYFLHFWADDDALKLARGLRAALARTRSRRE